VSRFDRDCEAFGKQYGQTEKRLSACVVIDALLKKPAQLVYELHTGRRQRTAIGLLLLVILTMGAYGLIMGTFSGGQQLAAVPLRVVGGVLVSALICLPSLYIFTCLCGSDLSFSDVAGLFLLCLALSGMLLIGFAPVTWIFSQSTHAVGFMAGLHLAFWMVGSYFGLRLMMRAFGFLNRKDMGLLKVWVVVFLLVVLQMCTTLRPLVGPYRPINLAEKKFFLSHWVETMDAGNSRQRTDLGIYRR
jgi:hypothetical protein